MDKLIKHIEDNISDNVTTDYKNGVMDCIWLIKEYKQLTLNDISKRNWFERLPLHKRYLFYWFTGIALGLVIPIIFN